MAVLLGLDVGDIRIGVALSDELGVAAHPFVYADPEKSEGRSDRHLRPHFHPQGRTCYYRVTHLT